MNKRLLAILALTLCVGAFLFPMTSYAASDATPPTLRAWLNGELLHVEAADSGSGVEAVYIDGSRVNYRVDGAFDVTARDYAGTGEYISVHAVDFAGNKSDTVLIKNPYYTPTPAPTATPKPTAPAATQKPASTPAVSATPAPTVTPAPTESTVPAEPQPFTPDGTGTVMDNIVEQNGKEFFTITTADGNEFFLIIDRQRNGENVYLLNAVTEDDLKALAKKSGGTSESAVPTPEPTPQPTQPTPEPTPEPEPPAKSGGNTSAIILILLAVLGVGGAGYYFKIVKPKQQAPDMDDYDDDDSDYDGDSEDDYDGYDSEDDSGSITEEE